QVRDALRSTASRKDAPDNLYGWGIINALQAVNYVKSLTTSVNGAGKGIPEDFTLYQNYPNPFNPSTSIKFYIPAASAVKLELYNVLGVKVASVFEGNLEKGSHIFTFDGSGYASGVYFARLYAGGHTNSIKMTLQK
ncbi:MAG: T9SS type A sorting domain-containing protein, partial [Syntrophothermus sp.]